MIDLILGQYNRVFRIVCRLCKEPFETSVKHAKYCPKCRKEHYQKCATARWRQYKQRKAATA